jgi:hypothetical protein
MPEWRRDARHRMEQDKQLPAATPKDEAVRDDA